MQTGQFYDSSTFVVRMTSKAIERAMDIELRRRCNMTIGQSRVLACLYVVRNGMSQAEIADKLGIEAPTLVPIIDKLEESGLVERKPDPMDRRTKFVFLRAPSKAVWTSIIECGRSIELISHWGINDSDIKTTLSVLKKMRENVVQHIGDERWSADASQKTDAIAKSGRRAAAANHAPGRHKVRAAR